MRVGRGASTCSQMIAITWGRPDRLERDARDRYSTWPHADSQTTHSARMAFLAGLRALKFLRCVLNGALVLLLLNASAGLAQERHNYHADTSAATVLKTTTGPQLRAPPTRARSGSARGAPTTSTSFTRRRPARSMSSAGVLSRRARGEISRSVRAPRRRSRLAAGAAR